MSDALINGLAGAGGGIIAQLLTYPLQTVGYYMISMLVPELFFFFFYFFVLDFDLILQVNTRQQTERDPKKEKRKLGTIEQISQVVKHEGWERLYGD
ncbi:hypothetical protein GH714_036966 [Hevea brasiliensis]|uniref:Uncharacterized protein n=1 Tax=Hevea brasiliensis TaxID=3981 RepID=A0A6A6L7Z1_HEVBR|nr:hypothetical protein GH714_036966 [Hevea brasiliensis]